MNHDTPIEVRYNTILHVANEQKRSLTKRELVKLTKVSNQVIKHDLSALVKQGYFKKEGSKYIIIKTLEGNPTLPPPSDPRLEVQGPILEVFKNLKETDSTLSIQDLDMLLDKKFKRQQLYSGLYFLVKSGKLKRVKTGNYMLVEMEISPKTKVPRDNSKYEGITGDIRSIFSKMPEKFTVEDVLNKLEHKCPRNIISTILSHLKVSGELTHVSHGVYTIKDNPDKEISPTDAIDEKEEKFIREKEISAAKAVEESQKFVRLQLGYKKFDGDYALVIKIGAALAKAKGWKDGDTLMIGWTYDMRLLRIYPYSGDRCCRLIENSNHAFELVCPMPEGTDYMFPKPVVLPGLDKNPDIEIPITQITYLKGSDIRISLKDVKGINYV